MPSCASSTRAKPVSAKWRKLLRRIPGYDPFASAGECEFDARAAQDAIDFFRLCLTHVKGEKARQPFLLEPWEQAIVANLFGWKRPGGSRRYREAFIFVARKNGKTTFAAGLVHLVAFTDGEPGAELYSAGADRDQARLVFAQAKGMIENDPDLRARATVYHNAITYPDGGSYKAISAEAFTKFGFNTHFAVIDELHAQPNRELVDVLITSTGARRQPLIVHITTSDYDREGSICNEKYEYACRVRDGIIDDPSFLPVIYEATEADDWTKISTWRKANPNLGVSLSVEYLRRECLRAQETPTYENTFKRLHLNIKTRTDVKWLAMDKWDSCGGDLDPGELAGQACYAGLDLASTTDIAALVLLFPGVGNAVLPFFWVPAESARIRERRDRVPYETWARQGLIEMTEGNVIDYDVIRRRINELGELYNIREIAVDRWNAQQIITQLDGDGFEVVPFGQGYASLSGPSKELEKLVLSCDLRHGGHPVLRWMASNVMAETDAAGNIKPSKKKSREKIDGIVGLVMALGLAIVAEPPQRSVYEDRGVIVI